jgi:hypothetical protein
MQSQNAGIGRAEDWDKRLARRQARVGIVANPVKVALPPCSPREVWTRWPKLRSARRLESLRHMMGAQTHSKALGPSDDSLKGFVHESRDPSARQSTRAHPEAQGRMPRAGGIWIVAGGVAAFVMLWFFA